MRVSWKILPPQPAPTPVFELGGVHGFCRWFEEAESSLSSRSDPPAPWEKPDDGIYDTHS